jgi:hypothetical protein
MEMRQKKEIGDQLRIQGRFEVEGNETKGH